MYFLLPDDNPNLTVHRHESFGTVSESLVSLLKTLFGLGCDFTKALLFSDSSLTSSTPATGAGGLVGFLGRSLEPKVVQYAA